MPDPETSATLAAPVVACSVCGHKAHPETPGECGRCPEGYCEEPEWDDEDSNRYQDRIEAGLEPGDGSDHA